MKHIGGAYASDGCWIYVYLHTNTQSATVFTIAVHTDIREQFSAQKRKRKINYYGNNVTLTKLASTLRT